MRTFTKGFRLKPGEASAANGMKPCSRCNRRLPVDQFKRNRRQPDGFQTYCHSCRREYGMLHYQRRKAENENFLTEQAAILRRQVLARKLLKYGLTQSQYDSLAAKGCAICSGPPNGRGRYAFDHDHKTGKFRGLLCSRCNTALGLFLDNPNLIGSANKYLAEHVE